MDGLAKYQTPILITVGLSTGMVILYQAFSRLFLWDRLKQIFGGKKKWVQVGRLGQILIHPVKGMRGKFLSKAYCSQMGLVNGEERDRQFVVIDEKDKNISIYTQPKFALLTPTLEGGVLTLRTPDREPISVELARVHKEAKVVKIQMLGGSFISGFECGSAVSDWLCEFLEKPKGFYRLLYFEPELSNERIIANDRLATAEMKKYKKQKPIYANTTPFQLTSTTSLEDLNSRLPPDAKPVIVRNFRSNFVIESVEKPYDEDYWREIRIGDHVTLKTMKPSNRCPATTTDTDTGIKREDNEPLKTLKTFRLADTEEAKKFFHFSPLFGLSLALDSEGEVKVGDPVFAVYQKKKVGIIGL